MNRASQHIAPTLDPQRPYKCRAGVNARIQRFSEQRESVTVISRLSQYLHRSTLPAR